MHGKCTARYLGGVPHVHDVCGEPYAGPACKTFFKMDQSWLLLRSGMPSSSPPHLPLNLSLFILFLSPSLIPLTLISDPCFGIACGSTFYTNDHVLPAYCARGQCRTASMHTTDGSLCHCQPWGTCANGTCRAHTPPRVGMTPSPFIFSLSVSFFFFF